MDVETYSSKQVLLIGFKHKTLSLYIIVKVLYYQTYHMQLFCGHNVTYEHFTCSYVPSHEDLRGPIDDTLDRTQ